MGEIRLPKIETIYIHSPIYSYICQYFNCPGDFGEYCRTCAFNSIENYDKFVSDHKKLKEMEK